MLRLPDATTKFDCGAGKELASSMNERRMLDPLDLKEFRAPPLPLMGRCCAGTQADTYGSLALSVEGNRSSKNKDPPNTLRDLAICFNKHTIYILKHNTYC